ncbi:MAG: peptidoglycan-binding protein [Pseudoclavibacter sp.]
MVNTPQQALSRANGLAKGYAGLCLAFVSGYCYQAAARYPSAIAAWNASAHKVRTSDTRQIPVGAPIFFSGSKYGHVAVYAGGGLMRTTNSRTGLIHTHTVSSWVAAGYTLLGYTTDIEGQPIPGLGSSQPDVLRRGVVSERVRRWQQWARRAFPAYAPASADASFGPDTERFTREFQRRTGLTPDGIADPATQAKAQQYGWRG